MAEIVSFYSYKGGVGRSMAVANLACLLAGLGHKVLVVDFDLEAPGLHRYFGPQRATHGVHSVLGVIDLFDALREEFARGQTDGETIVSQLLASRFGPSVLSVRNHGRAQPLTIDFMGAGRLDADYVERVREFPWATFFQEHPEAFSALATAWKKNYDYILLDSRTGISDVGSVSTVILPDKLVLVFTPNQQSLLGAIDFGRQAMALKRQLDPSLSLPLFPLLSRVDEGEEEERRKWVANAAAQFHRLFADSGTAVDFARYFTTVQVPHRSHYAYGERIAVEEEETSAIGSQAEGYARFLECLRGPTLQGWELRARNAARPDIARTPTLWLTYAHADNKDKDVDFIAQELRRTGIAVHLDRWEIKPGERLWDRIEAGIKACDAWMIYATENSTASPWCREELAWALDRALTTKGSTYPIIALFPGGFDSSILPSSLKVRLGVSTTDDDWRERVLSAVAGRSPQIDTPALAPYVIKVHPLAMGGQYRFAIEVRPRAGVWSPFIAAVPATGPEFFDLHTLIFGAKDAPDPSAAGTLLSVSTGIEGPWSWIWVNGQQASPTLSAYLYCQQLPSKVLFGAASGIQYIADNLQGPGPIRVIEATTPSM